MEGGTFETEDVQWRKSSYSGGSGTECVEVASHAADVAVRDSKVPQGPRIRLGVDAWADFIRTVQLGHHA